MLNLELDRDSDGLIFFEGSCTTIGDPNESPIYVEIQDDQLGISLCWPLLAFVHDE